jgi:uncharacterized protein (DUF488 family)
MTDRGAIHVYTIGFTHKKAEDFFRTLQDAGVKRLYDIRLNNASQLAGFTKKDDLRYFLSTIAGIEYFYKPEFSPTKNILDAYKKKEMTWDKYEDLFKTLVEERHIENAITLEELEYSCFLCSEPKPDKCHRRLVVEYLKQHFPDIIIRHL